MKFGLRELVVVVLLLAIPVAAWWFIFRPKNARDRGTLQQIEAKRARVAELNKATATIGDIEREIEGLEKGITFLESKLPSEKEIDKVVREMWRLAQRNRLKTKSIRQGERNNAPAFTAPGTHHAEQPIVVKLEGDFRGFYAFLLALEAQPRIMRIRTMDLKKPPNGLQGNVEAELEMTVFFERS